MSGPLKAIVFEPPKKWVPVLSSVHQWCTKIIEEALKTGAVAPEAHNGSTHLRYVVLFPTVAYGDGFHTQDSLQRCVRSALIKAYKGCDVVIHIGDRHRIRARASGHLASGGIYDLYLEGASFVREDNTPWFKLPEGKAAQIHSRKVQAISVR